MTSGCFVLDALGFKMSPLLPTVRGPEKPELVEHMRASLATADDVRGDCFELIAFPARARRTVCLPDDAICAAASEVAGELVCVTRDYDSRPEWNRWAIHSSALSDVDKSSEIVSGKDAIDSRARMAIADRDGWAAVSWRFGSKGEPTYAGSVALVSLDGKQIVWNRPTGCVGEVAIVDDTRLVSFSVLEGERFSTRVCSFDGAEDRKLAPGEFLALDRSVGIALVRDKAIVKCVRVSDGTIVLDAAKLTGLAGRVLGVYDEHFAVYQALPTEGAPQHRHRMGLTAPPDFSTIKICDLRTGEFATLDARCLWYGAFAVNPR
ncbi:MAG: hypothetical protein K8S98_09030 [Planctomycetes bacterium]|nr:hypothetical protein [Planctomycetota bacterium]